MNISKAACPLCLSEASFFNFNKKEEFNYFHCNVCDLRFKNPELKLNLQDEKKRYLEHNNSLFDEGYQNYLRPLFDLICSKVPAGAIGLDYGSGFAPTLSQMLSRKSYELNLFDPFFANDEDVLRKEYDFIVSAEVVEHFSNPLKEFSLLEKILKKGGALGIMTRLYEKSINFDSWFYRRDNTHISFYSIETFRWIKTQFNFESVEFVNERTIFLKK